MSKIDLKGGIFNSSCALRGLPECAPMAELGSTRITVGVHGVNVRQLHAVNHYVLVICHLLSPLPWCAG